MPQEELQQRLERILEQIKKNLRKIEELKRLARYKRNYFWAQINDA